MTALSSIAALGLSTWCGGCGGCDDGDDGGGGVPGVAPATSSPTCWTVTSPSPSP